ncbi:MAG: thioredoxin fold domain-containing protein [Flavobacteriaceae bacterium]|nr:thioredoxin fold domain-containing protein [Flavobacteriaceae bacterium]
MKSVYNFLFLIIPLSFFAQAGINFENSTFKEILDKAKKENKIIFLDAYTSWCGPCKMMEKNIFPLPSVGEFYNTNFINAHFDMEKGEGKEIAKKYNVLSYPTYLFINGDGDLVSRNFGYLGENDFITIGKEVLDPENGGVSLRERFDNGDKNPDFLMKIMQQNYQTDYDFAKKASERYFKNKPISEWTKDDANMLLFFTRSTSDENYKIFSDRKTELLKYISEADYKGFDDNVKVAKFLENALDEKNKTVKDDYFLKNAIPIVGEKEAKKALNRLKINFYPAVQNFKEYEKAALEYYQNPNEFNANELLQAAFIFSEHIENPNSIKKAKEWAEQTVMQGENAENTYVLAKLYYKSGEKEPAELYAEYSKNIAEQNGKDSTKAAELLKAIQQLK